MACTHLVYIPCCCEAQGEFFKCLLNALIRLVGLQKDTTDRRGNPLDSKKLLFKLNEDLFQYPQPDIHSDSLACVIMLSSVSPIYI